MKSINQYFDKVLLINLARREDRLAESEAELKRCGIEATRVEGVEMRDWGNDGCTWAHRKVLDIIVTSQWDRVLVLEDDFQAEFEDVQTKFSHMIPLVPPDWDLLYLGGHYADEPKGRVNQNVIRINRMKTTSSYGITRRMAVQMAPSIAGTGPIDEFFSGFTEKSNSYIFQPRLFVQRAGFSDIQRHLTNHSACMQDCRHEQMV